MTDDSSLVTLEATAEPAQELLRAPASGQPCVHWRLRVVEHLTASSELVHDLASPEPFDLAWGGASSEPGGAPVRIRLDPETARLEATPTLYRVGTPGAQTVARAFGFRGHISVEEVIIRAGDTVNAEGLLQEVGFAGPFRGPSQSLALLEATVRIPSRSLAPSALIPWAFGTAAVLLGGLGLATWVAWRYHEAHLPGGDSAYRVETTPHTTTTAQVSAPDFPHPRFP